MMFDSCTTKGVWVGLYNVMMLHWLLLRAHAHGVYNLMMFHWCTTKEVRERALQCHDVSLVTTKGVWVGLYNVMMFYWLLLRGYG